MSSGAYWQSASLRLKPAPLTEEERQALAPKLEGVVWKSHYKDGGFVLQLVWHGYLWETRTCYGEVPFPLEAYTELLILAAHFRCYGWTRRCSMCNEPWTDLATCRDCCEEVCKECSVDWDSDEGGLTATCVPCRSSLCHATPSLH